MFERATPQGYKGKHHIDLGQSTKHHTGERNLIASMITLAIKEMRLKGAAPNRVSAIGWLASNVASKWMDFAGLDQRWLLDTIGWYQHATDLLTRAAEADYQHNGTPMNMSWIRVIEDTVEWYEGEHK